jgi:hypothetical protein
VRERSYRFAAERSGGWMKTRTDATKSQRRTVLRSEATVALSCVRRHSGSFAPAL